MGTGAPAPATPLSSPTEAWAIQPCPPFDALKLLLKEADYDAALELINSWDLRVNLQARPLSRCDAWESLAWPRMS